jgi:hypothetical protein
MRKIYFVFTLLFSASFLFAQHTLPIYEPFDGALGSLAGQKGWTGNLTPGNGAQVTDYALSYTGLPLNLTSKSVLYGNQSSGGTQALGFESQTGTVYASFLFEVSSIPLSLANSRYNFGYGSSTTGGTFAGCLYVVPTGETKFKIGFNGTNQQPSEANTTIEEYDLNKTIMIVMAYTPGAAGAGTVSGWINPDASTFGGTAPAPNFANVAGGNAATVASVFIRSGNNTNPMVIDELRVGTSWANVTSYNVPLPVAITGLSLTNKNNVSRLAWESKSEVNFDKYVVLFSENSVDYKEVGSVKGRGSNVAYSFEYAHKGNAFFKLKMVDKDGQFKYSSVLLARAAGDFAVLAAPNPFSHQITVYNLPAGTNSITLYDANGARLKMANVQEGNYSMSAPNLPAGKYHLMVMNNGTLVYSQPFMKLQ